MNLDELYRCPKCDYVRAPACVKYARAEMEARRCPRCRSKLNKPKQKPVIPAKPQEGKDA